MSESVCVCGSIRFMCVSAKCSDLCSVTLDGIDTDGYVPSNLNIGESDYVEFSVCAECGQMRGKWPLQINALEIDQ